LLPKTYHIEVINMNEGSEHASAASEKALSTASCAKFFAQVRNIRKAPHINILTLKYFPIGNLCIMKFVETTFRQPAFPSFSHLDKLELVEWQTHKPTLKI
jgi:hypothetical protein